MTANIKLGKIWGIPIGLNTSWFLVFALVIISLSSGYFPQEYPDLPASSHIVLAAVTALGLFGSVLLHELGHARIAQRNGIPVKGISLFIFGGVAQISREPHSPGVEFRIAIAGPIVSLGLAALFGGLWLIDREVPWLAAPSIYLARLNLTLALFNMIPGFPLDGGRVLRSLIWKFTGNPLMATKIASSGGKLVAFGFLGLGAFSMLAGNLFNGLWLIFIGWFLQNAASSATQQAVVQEKLTGIPVSQVMDHTLSTIQGLTPLHEIVTNHVLARGQSAFFVTDFYGKIIGLLTLQDITAKPQSQWRYFTAGQVMIPIDRLLQVDAGSELISALQRMNDAEAHHLAVVQRDQTIGVLSRDHIVRYLQLRGNLGI